MDWEHLGGVPSGAGGNILKDGQFIFITTLLWIAALSAEDFYVVLCVIFLMTKS